MARIAVIFTGGTIAMRHDARASGNIARLRGSDLLAMADLGEIAQIEAIDWGLVPASHLSFEQVLDIGRVLAEQLARPDIDGAVVVQGTDVIEETAFAWDLLPLPSKPVIVVGAMRSASQDGYDGRENLRNAVTAATDGLLADQGVVVAMAGELHAADDVRKTNTHSYASFQSLNAGRLGFVADGRLTLLRQRRPIRLPCIPQRAGAPVPLVTVALNDVGAIESAIARRPLGLVVAATGSGNTPVSYLDAVRPLIEGGIPVALATRCPAGRTSPGYGFPGGSSAWWQAGAIFTGTLDGLKARMLLALGIGAGISTFALAAMVASYGGGARTRS